METSKYFDTLLQLYEAASVSDVDRHQQNVADTGSDVEDPNVLPQAKQQEIQPEEDPQMNQQPQQGVNPEEASENPEGLEDAAYLNNSTSGVAPTGQSDNSKKLVKLFELMQNLLTYSNTFGTTLDSVELGLLDDSDLEKAHEYRHALEELETKVHDYLIDNFEYNGYEQNVYAYVLFRTELLTIVKNIRDTLKLNEVDDEKDIK